MQPIKPLNIIRRLRRCTISVNVLPDIEDRMEIPRGEVQLRSALHPEIRRPIVLEIPTTAIKKEASEEDNPLLSAIYKTSIWQ